MSRKSARASWISVMCCCACLRATALRSGFGVSAFFGSGLGLGVSAFFGSGLGLGFGVSSFFSALGIGGGGGGFFWRSIISLASRGATSSRFFCFTSCKGKNCTMAYRMDKTIREMRT
ncbi:MAG: hypothetical protein GC149_04080 [Gammaproteobacteria bacterium]|nr:hypothetical protein [Gammaproteobacteria bacterium]